MSDKKIFYAKGDSPQMIAAFEKAQKTFKYFWRELSWEARRIVPALDLACVKVIFSQETANSPEPIVEHMWINDIDFDGDVISGTLINDPDALTNVKNGDFIEVPLSQISDWLFSIQGKTYGGFTIHAMRANMSKKELKEHDKAWGLDFGDFNEILLVYDQKKHPENLIEHPMCINMGDSLKKFLKENPKELTNKDEKGFTMLHREALAGNKTSVEILLESGADKQAKTHNGCTALDFAKSLEWSHIIPILQ
jgi:uncharacterized protein YegJ (DUF2314 family)